MRPSQASTLGEGGTDNRNLTGGNDEEQDSTEGNNDRTGSERSELESGFRFCG
jgi:hypothetical protein